MRSRVYERTFRTVYKTAALKKQQGKCLYCTEYLPLKLATAEHKKPRSLGGKTTSENIDAACRRCNQLKGSYSKSEFNQAINNPDIKRDTWPLHLAGIEMRIIRRTERACKNIMSIIRRPSKWNVSAKHVY